jgi:hypothetical protein
MVTGRSSQASYDAGSGESFSLAVGDLNGDGKFDVVLAHEEV